MLALVGAFDARVTPARLADSDLIWSSASPARVPEPGRKRAGSCLGFAVLFRAGWRFEFASTSCLEPGCCGSCYAPRSRGSRLQAQRFIPAIASGKRLDHLARYLFGSRVVAVGVAIWSRAFCAGLVRLLQSLARHYTSSPLPRAARLLPPTALSERAGLHFPLLDWSRLRIVQLQLCGSLLLTGMSGAAYLASAARWPYCHVRRPAWHCGCLPL